MMNPDVRSLPHGLTARAPQAHDVDVLVGLLHRHEASVLGDDARVSRDAIASRVVGKAALTRWHRVVADSAGRLVGWVSAHDRAAGRTVVEVTVAPGCPEGDQLADALFEWAYASAHRLARQRGLAGAQLDSGCFADDGRQQTWLARAGYRRMRTWLQMSRPVRPGERDTLPQPPPNVQVRLVTTHPDGSPVAGDVQTVHSLIEESFVDHFNSHREGVAEFLARQGEEPGHRWDHWWLATAEIGGTTIPSGAVIGTELPPDDAGVWGSYVVYIGVHPRARGLGVAKALLQAVIADADARGRNRVGLEVDGDSLTGADRMYAAMGWRTKYATESWHHDITVD